MKRTIVLLALLGTTQVSNYAAEQQPKRAASEENKITCPLCQKSYIQNYFKDHVCKPIEYEKFAASFTEKIDSIDTSDLPTDEMSFAQFAKPQDFGLTSLATITSQSCPVQKVQCQECGKLFHPRSIKRHRETHNSDRKLFTCEICNKSFLEERYFNEHVRMHSNPDAVTCSECDELFATPATLKNHSDLFHSTQQKTPKQRQKVEKPVATQNSNDLKESYKTLCEEGFTSSIAGFMAIQGDALSNEVVTSAASKTKKIQCIVCAKSVHPNSLKRHMENHDKNKERLACNYDGCSSTFTEKSKLREHQRTHTNPEEFTCPVCKAVFATIKNLKTHRTNIHPTQDDTEEM